MSRGYMPQGVYVLGGKCPGGKCPGGKCPGGICPWGKCPGGTCPLCPRTTFSMVLMVNTVRHNIRGTFLLTWVTICLNNLLIKLKLYKISQSPG